MLFICTAVSGSAAGPWLCGQVLLQGQMLCQLALCVWKPPSALTLRLS